LAFYLSTQVFAVCTLLADCLYWLKGKGTIIFANVFFIVFCISAVIDVASTTEEPRYK
jgi:energy-converting hydrogenase Eha subunit F